jgi:hypothetical protein
VARGIFIGQARGFGHADLLLYKRWISSLSAVRRRHRRLRQPSKLCSRVTPRPKYTPIAPDRARRSQIRYCRKATVGHRLVSDDLDKPKRKFATIALQACAIVAMFDVHRVDDL